MKHIDLSRYQSVHSLLGCSAAGPILYLCSPGSISIDQIYRKTGILNGIAGKICF